MGLKAQSDHERLKFNLIRNIVISTLNAIEPLKLVKGKGGHIQREIVWLRRRAVDHEVRGSSPAVALMSFGKTLIYICYTQPR